MRLKALFILVLSLTPFFLHSQNTIEEEWTLVADSYDIMPLDSVVCLAASDISDRLTVVGRERNIDNVEVVSFELTERSGIKAEYAETNHDISCLKIGNEIIIRNLTQSVLAEIYNLEGQLFYSKIINPDIRENKINVGNLPAGIYIVSIGRRNFKIHKQ